MFLIWFANLDKPTALARNQPVQESFPPDLISGISGELQSLVGLIKKIKDLDKSLTDRVHSIEREQTYYRLIGGIVLAVFIAMTATWIRDGGPNRLFSPIPAVSSAVMPAAPRSAPAKPAELEPQKAAGGPAKP
jgi:dCTP deaminase